MFQSQMEESGNGMKDVWAQLTKKRLEPKCEKAARAQRQLSAELDQLFFGASLENAHSHFSFRSKVNTTFLPSEPPGSNPNESLDSGVVASKVQGSLEESFFGSALEENRVAEMYPNNDDQAESDLKITVAMAESNQSESSSSE